MIGNNPSHFKDCGDNCPVEMVSWNDVQDFIKKLNQQEGTDKYRLPTEAEWEYACRAGTNTTFSFGICLSFSVYGIPIYDLANYDGKYPLKNCPKGKYRKRTVLVASFAPNAWGLYDMHGNIWEWCQDWYGKYPADAVINPTGTDSGSHRVNRGGGYFGGARDCRSAYRDHDPPDARDNNLGFRLLRKAP